MLKIFLLTFIFFSYNYAEQNHNYLLEHYKKSEVYNKNTNEQYNNFIKAYSSSFKEYKENISKYWEDILVTSNFLYVVYSNDFKQRTIINYKKSTIIVEVIQQDIKIAQKEITKRFKELFLLTNQMAFRNELVLRNTYRKLNIIFDTPLNDELLIGDILSSTYKEHLIQETMIKEYKEQISKNKIYFSYSFNLPDNFKKSIQNRYIKYINKYEKTYNLPKNILYSIIKVKTSFNPYALNSNGEFGLMLINSNIIGLKAYYKLYKDKRILDASYLYDFKNNILIGSTYFSILYNDKLKDIKNNKTKMYLSIIAYEIGIKKTLDLFKNIENINKFNAGIMYRKILQKLKKRNLRIYFSKVVNTQKNTKLML